MAIKITIPSIHSCLPCTVYIGFESALFVILCSLFFCFSPSSVSLGFGIRPITKCESSRFVSIHLIKSGPFPWQLKCRLSCTHKNVFFLICVEQSAQGKFKRELDNRNEFSLPPSLSFPIFFCYTLMILCYCQKDISVSVTNQYRLIFCFCFVFFCILSINSRKKIKSKHTPAIRLLYICFKMCGGGFVPRFKSVRFYLGLIQR